jgi:hypothetical protein
MEFKPHMPSLLPKMISSLQGPPAPVALLILVPLSPHVTHIGVWCVPGLRALTISADRVACGDQRGHGGCAGGGPLLAGAAHSPDSNPQSTVPISACALPRRLTVVFGCAWLQILNAFETFGPMLEDYLYLIIPQVRSVLSATARCRTGLDHQFAIRV